MYRKGWSSEEWKDFYIKNLKDEIREIFCSASILKKFSCGEIMLVNNKEVLRDIIANRREVDKNKVQLIWDDCKIDDIFDRARELNSFAINGSSIDTFKEKIQDLIKSLEYAKQFNVYLFMNICKLGELYNDYKKLALM